MANVAHRIALPRLKYPPTTSTTEYSPRLSIAQRSGGKLHTSNLPNWVSTLKTVLDTYSPSPTAFKNRSTYIDLFEAIFDKLKHPLAIQ